MSKESSPRPRSNSDRYQLKRNGKRSDPLQLLPERKKEPQEYHLQYSQGSLGFSLLFPFYLCCFAWGNGAEMGLVVIINVPVPTKIDHLPHPKWHSVEGYLKAIFPAFFVPLPSFSFLFSSLFLSPFFLI